MWNFMKTGGHAKRVGKRDRTPLDLFPARPQRHWHSWPRNFLSPHRFERNNASEGGLTRFWYYLPSNACTFTGNFLAKGCLLPVSSKATIRTSEPVCFLKDGSKCNVDIRYDITSKLVYRRPDSEYTLDELCTELCSCNPYSNLVSRGE